MKSLAFEIIFEEIKERKRNARDELVGNYAEFNAETKQLFLANGLAWDNRR